MPGERLGAPQPEPQPVDPVQEARTAFNSELLGKEYHPGALITRTLQYHRALLGSGLSREKIYHESAIIAAQGAQRAALFDDTLTAEPLNELQRNYELTYETFASLGAANSGMSGSEAIRAAQPQPTQTESLPPMTAAKGGELPTQPRTRTRQTKSDAPTTVANGTPAESDISIPASATQGEQTTVFEQPTNGEDNQGQQENPKFDALLKQFRTRSGKSQGVLGRDAGNVTQATVSKWERGGLPENEGKVREIATSLGLNDEETTQFLETYRKQVGQITPPSPSEQ